MKQPEVFTGELLELHREAFRLQGRHNNRWEGKSMFEIGEALQMTQAEVQDVLYEKECHNAPKQKRR